jgi:hypothetical protein
VDSGDSVFTGEIVYHESWPKVKIDVIALSIQLLDFKQQVCTSFDFTLTYYMKEFSRSNLMFSCAEKIINYDEIRDRRLYLVLHIVQISLQTNATFRPK